jgi:hypothetical protein
MSLALIVCLVGSARPMIAQEKVKESTRSAFVSPHLAEAQGPPFPAEGLVGIAQPAQRRSSRDTLKNGAIIGALVGAVGLGAFGALLCHLYREEGGASCLPDTLRVAAIGAAVGTGAGVAVDAALARNAGVAVLVGVRF